MYRLSILIVCVLCNINTLMAQGLGEDPNLQAAYQAQGALALQESISLFKKVSTNTSASKKDRCEALRELAIIEWKHYKNYDKALSYLKIADSIGDYRSETWLKILRVELDVKHYTNALKAGEKAINLSESKSDKTYAKYKYCRVILNEAIHQLNNKKVFSAKKLSEAALLLQEVLAVNPTHVNAADVLLGISLMLEDGETAMTSWLTYNRFSDVNSAYDYFKPTAKQLSTIFNMWKRGALDKASQVALIEALGASRFYNYAHVVSKMFNINDSETAAYANYMQDIKQLVNEYYRLVSINKGESQDFMNALESKNEVFYSKISGANVAFDLSTFRERIREKFGSVFLISSSSASRQVGLVYGHIVNERVRTIKQYNHKADFTFTELDMMVSNGYPSWFWEDRGAGGYALSGGFLRIKPLFKFLAIDAWERVTDSIKRSKIEENINTNLYNSDFNTDIKVLKATLSKKIELDALDELYDQLKRKGFNGLDLQLKFIEHYELLRDNATMFAHEGRHSIDRVVLGSDYRAQGSKIIEYRGRLSQIAFSDAPKLELANMLNGVSSTPTGQSNQMIIDVIENWIKENSKLIKGYNAKQLPLANLYKLTDAQIISCIQNVDPFYLEYIKQKE